MADYTQSQSPAGPQRARYTYKRKQKKVTKPRRWTGSQTPAGSPRSNPTATVAMRPAPRPRRYEDGTPIPPSHYRRRPRKRRKSQLHPSNTTDGRRIT